VAEAMATLAPSESDIARLAPVAAVPAPVAPVEVDNSYEQPAPPPVISGGGRPVKGYKTSDGKRVPSVTTVTKRFQESGGLIQWAFNCGRDGIDMNRVRDEAADAGHVAHQWVDDTIHGRPLREYRDVPDEMLEGPRAALAAFIEWRNQVQLEIVETETPLVSDALKFGGTFDAIFRISGKLYLGDWKTGNRVYAEHLAQLGGYAILLAERGTELHGAQLLRFDKEFGSFAHYSWPAPVLDLGKAAFLQMRGLYDVCARLGKAVG
jgi:hypothetical protein